MCPHKHIEVEVKLRIRNQIKLIWLHTYLYSKVPKKKKKKKPINKLAWFHTWTSTSSLPPRQLMGTHLRNQLNVFSSEVTPCALMGFEQIECALCGLYRKIGKSKTWKFSFFHQRHTLWTSFDIFVVTYRVTNFLPKLIDMLLFSMENWISIFGFPLFSGYARFVRVQNNADLSLSKLKSQSKVCWRWLWQVPCSLLYIILKWTDIWSLPKRGETTKSDV